MSSDFKGYKKLIKGYLILFFMCFALFFLVGWNIDHSYRAYATVSPAEDNASLLSSSLNSIGGGVLSGFLGGDSPQVQVALATLKSQVFLNTFVKKYKYQDQIGNPESPWAIHDAMLNRLNIEKSTGSTIMNISLNFYDAGKSSTALNQLISELNLYLMQEELKRLEIGIGIFKEKISKTINKEELEMLYLLLEKYIDKKVLLLSQSDFALKVIDPAKKPHKKYWPNYLLLSLSAFGMFLFFALVHYLLHFYQIREKLS